jgi:hypothetical protein
MQRPCFLSSEELDCPTIFFVDSVKCGAKHVSFLWLFYLVQETKVGRSLGTRAIIEALKSSDGDIRKVLDGEFLELSSQSEQNFSDCSK